MLDLFYFTLLALPIIFSYSYSITDYFCLFFILLFCYNFFLIFFFTAFFENKELCEEVLIKKAILLGRYQAREITAISQLHKYRTMNKRYQ